MTAPVRIRQVACAPSAAATEAQRLADFFAGVLLPNPDYISHSEYFGGQSPEGTTWCSGLAEVLATDFQSVLEGDPSKGCILEGLSEDSALLGALVALAGHNGHEAYWVIKDMAVARTAQGTGVGRALMAEAERLARQSGASRLVLESGIANHRAHRLFTRSGFRELSKVFVKPLG